MRAVVQRVARAEVRVDGAVVGSTQGRAGLLVLLGVAPGDGPAQVAWMSEKIAGLRIVPDGDGKMNRSVRDIDGRILVVSQVTLYGDVSKGRRPSFVGAAPPEVARPLVHAVRERLGAEGGVFGADMEVELVNDGPVTLVLDTP